MPRNSLAFHVQTCRKSKMLCSISVEHLLFVIFMRASVKFLTQILINFGWANARPLRTQFHRPFRKPEGLTGFFLGALAADPEDLLNFPLLLFSFLSSLTDRFHELIERCCKLLFHFHIAYFSLYVSFF